jgi:hypothetical protein
MEADSIPSKDTVRYWSDQHVVGGKVFRVCSQWVEGRHRIPFFEYLKSKDINDIIDGYTPVDVLTSSLNAPVMSGTHPQSNARFRSFAVGNAQNAVIRVILSKIAYESYNERDWQESKEYFGGGCAYCGTVTVLEMDHAIPMNRTALGEHRLGNVVPSCRQCNQEKHHRDFREYLGNDAQRIQQIASYMDSRNYIPLGDHEKVRMVLAQSHGEVASLVDRYISIINTILSDQRASD